MDLPKEYYDLLPVNTKGACEALNTMHQTPHEMTITTVLGIASLATQGLYDTSSYHTPSSPLSLYVCAIAPSGKRKTTIMKELTVGLKEYQHIQLKDYRKALSRFRVEHETWTKDHKKAVNDPKSPPVPIEPWPPTNPILEISKATLNGLLGLLDNTPSSALLADDAGEFFNSHAFQNKKSGNDIEFISMLSSLWSGTRVSRQIGKAEECLSFDGRRFTMLTMIQEELADFLSNPQYSSQGFIARNLISVAGDYDIPLRPADDDGSADKALKDGPLKVFNDRVLELLNDIGKKTIPVSFGGKEDEGLKALRGKLVADLEDDPAQLSLVEFPMDGEARQVVYEYAKQTKAKRNIPKYKEWDTFMDRRVEQMKRVATICSVFNGDNEVTGEMALLGLGIMDWYTDQRLALDLNVAASDPIVTGADALYKYMIAHKERAPFKNRDLELYGPGCQRKIGATGRKALLNELLAEEKLTVSENGKEYAAIEI